MLTTARLSEAADLRRIKPTKADQRRNPNIDVMADWRQLVEAAITRRIGCGELAPDDADAFRQAVYGA